MAILLKYQPVVGVGELGAVLLRLSQGLGRLRALMADPVRTRFIAVTRAAVLPRAETVRLLKRLGAAGVSAPLVVVNAAGAGTCRRCRVDVATQATEIAALQRQTATRGKGPATLVARAEMPPPHGPRRLGEWQTTWRAVTVAGARPAAPRPDREAGGDARGAISSDPVAVLLRLHVPRRISLLCRQQRAEAADRRRASRTARRRAAGTRSARRRAVAGDGVRTARSLRSGTARGVAARSRLGRVDRAGARSGGGVLRALARRLGDPDEALHDVLHGWTGIGRDAHAAPRARARVRTDRGVRGVGRARDAGPAPCASPRYPQAAGQRRGLPPRTERGTRRIPRRGGGHVRSRRCRVRRAVGDRARGAPSCGRGRRGHGARCSTPRSWFRSAAVHASAPRPRVWPRPSPPAAAR